MACYCFCHEMIFCNIFSLLSWFFGELKYIWLSTNFYFRRPGGDRIYGVFDHQLPAALKKLPFNRHLSLKNVEKVVMEADGYQPHLIAPEQGYRRLIEGSIGYFKGPAEASVDAVTLLTLFLDLFKMWWTLQILTCSSTLVYEFMYNVIYMISGHPVHTLFMF